VRWSIGTRDRKPRGEPWWRRKVRTAMAMRWRRIMGAHARRRMYVTLLF